DSPRRWSRTRQSVIHVTAHSVKTQKNEIWPAVDGQANSRLREIDLHGKEAALAFTKQQALDFHFGQRPGKIEVTPSKPCRTQRDLSLAYTPAWLSPALRPRRTRTTPSNTPLAEIS